MSVGMVLVQCKYSSTVLAEKHGPDGMGSLLLSALALEYLLLVALVGQWVFGRFGLVDGVPVFISITVAPIHRSRS